MRKHARLLLGKVARQKHHSRRRNEHFARILGNVLEVRISTCKTSRNGARLIKRPVDPPIRLDLFWERLEIGSEQLRFFPVLQKQRNAFMMRSKFLEYLRLRGRSEERRVGKECRSRGWEGQEHRRSR